MTPQRRRLEAARERFLTTCTCPECSSTRWNRWFAAQRTYGRYLSDIRHHTSRRTRARRHA